MSIDLRCRHDRETRALAADLFEAEPDAGLGNGGLCLNCPECHFPNCGFGKGV